MSYHRSPRDSLRADKVDYRGETNRGHRLEIWTCCKLCVSSYCLVLYGFCTIPKKTHVSSILKRNKNNTKIFTEDRAYGPGCFRKSNVTLLFLLSRTAHSANIQNIFLLHQINTIINCIFNKKSLSKN